MDFIHRDIKPHNIIVQDTQAYLIDFDLACSLTDPKFPIQPKLTGTPNYMAPEIWMYDKNIDYKLTDIYSFGVTIYYVFNKKNVLINAKVYPIWNMLLEILNQNNVIQDMIILMIS